MSFETCATKVKTWFKENGEDKVKMPDRVIDQMARLLDASGKDAITPAQFEAKMQAALTEYTERLSAKYKATQAMDAVIIERGKTNTLANSQAWQDKFKMDADKANREAFEARIMGGQARPGVGSNLSVRGTRQSLQATFLQFLHRALGENENALQQTDKTSDLTRDVYLEKGALEAKTQLGLTNNPQALEIAKAIKGYQNRMLSEAQSVSPFLEQSKDFIVSRNHNREAIVADGSPESKARWLSDIYKGAAKTSFIGNTAAEKMKLFGDMYEKIRAGTYDTPGAESHFWGVPGTGGDLARKMAPARAITFESPQAEFEYASKYGDDLYTALGKQAYSRADQISKISKWGSRAADNFQKEFYATARSLPEEQRESFLANQAHFKDMFDASMASSYSPATDLGGRFAQGIMNVQSAAKAGMHLPRSFNDFQNVVSQSRDAFGKTLVENTYEMAQAMVKGLSQYEDSKERMGDLGVFSHSMHRENLSLTFNPDAKPGATAQLAEMVGKYSGADIQQNVVKHGMAMVDSKHFGDFAATGKDLPQTALTELSRYGISPTDWKLMSKGTQTIPFMKGQSRGLMTPEAIRNLDNATVEAHLRETGQWTKDTTPPQQLLDRTKYEIATKYGSLLNDRAGTAAANLNERQRYDLFGNPADPNSGKALLNKMMWQFKGAAVANFGAVKRTMYSGESSSSNIAGLAQRVLMGGLYYTLGDYMIQAATGKTLADPTSPEMLAKFAIGSGGGGIWADGLINAMHAQDKSGAVANLAESIAGPGISSVGEGALATAFAAKGAAQQLGGNDKASLQGRWFAHLLQTNTPGQNIFYTKAGMDYFLFNELHELMGQNGYLESLRKQTEKTPGWPESLGGPGGQQGYTFGDGNFWGQ